VVTLTFADGTDDYFARQQVLEKLQTVALPPGIQPSLAPLSTAVGEIYRYILDAPPHMTQSDLRSLQDWTIRPALKITPGVAEVVSFGGTVREYQVLVDPNALRRYNVTLDQVSQALSSNSANVGGGLAHRGEEALVIRGIGILRGVDDIGRIAIMAKAGKTVLVSDIAEVKIGERPRSGIVAYNQNDSVVQGIVQMTKGGNASQVIGDLKQRVEELNVKLPNGVKIRPIYDRTQLISHTVHTVAENLLVGAALVIALLVIFLRNWRAALVVATVIPLSLLFAFIALHALNIPANLISLGTVDFGIIIDGAVVLVEALMVRLAARNFDPGHAEINAAWRITVLKNTVIELGHPILFAKAIIIVAFIPIFTFQRVEG
ncbi:MAG: efflux RND transporter permease subunit, partial [Lacisediminimonas sp.]|nr:efflux RND transporter permease subunit [Lacisediminimonas sp.]